MKNQFLVLTILTISLFSPAAHATTAIHELWSEASLAYKNGDYIKAAEYFSQAAKNPSQKSWQAHFNAGNSFLKAANYAEALDHYWKAWLINPRPAILWRNLDIASSRVGDSLVPPGTPRIIFRCWNFLTLDEWIVLSLVLWLLSACCFASLQFLKAKKPNQHAAQLLLKRLGFSSLIALIFSLPCTLTQYYSHRRPWLILQGPGLLRSGPSENLPITLQVPEGRFVYIIKQNDDGWIQIETRRERLHGWMRP